MKKHVKIYFKSLGHMPAENQIYHCEHCGTMGRDGFDIHHIERRGMGGSRDKDYPENLICLCRKCHIAADGNKIDKEVLKRIAKQRIELCTTSK